MPPPLSSARGRPSPRALPSRRNVAVLSHAEYVPRLTAAAAFRVKATLSKAAWWPCWPFDFESGVRVTCDVGYLCANFGLRPLCSRVTPDVRDRQTSDRQTDVRQKHRLMPRLLGGHNNALKELKHNTRETIQPRTVKRHLALATSPRVVGENNEGSKSFETGN